MEVNSKKKKERKKETESESETENYREHREKKTREVLKPKSDWSAKFGVCISPPGFYKKVWICGWKKNKKKKTRQLSCLTALLFIFLVLSREINEGSGYSLNIYKNKLLWILS